MPINLVRTRVHQISRQDDRPPGSDARSLYMEITCSRRTTVRTSVPHRPDVALKQEISLAKFLEFRSCSYLSGRLMTTVLPCTRLDEWFRASGRSARSCCLSTSKWKMKMGIFSNQINNRNIIFKKQLYTNMITTTYIYVYTSSWLNLT
jgi:hypothetical protein